MTKIENNILLISITVYWAASYIFIRNLPPGLSSYAYITLTTGIAAGLSLKGAVLLLYCLPEQRGQYVWKRK